MNFVKLDKHAYLQANWKSSEDSGESQKTKLVAAKMTLHNLTEGAQHTVSFKLRSNTISKMIMPSLMKQEGQMKVLSGAFLTTDKATRESFVEIYRARLDAASTLEE